MPRPIGLLSGGPFNADLSLRSEQHIPLKVVPLSQHPLSRQIPKMTSKQCIFSFQKLPNSVLQRYLTWFLALDEDGNGQISAEELRQYRLSPY